MTHEAGRSTTNTRLVLLRMQAELPLPVHTHPKLCTNPDGLVHLSRRQRFDPHHKNSAGHYPDTWASHNGCAIHGAGAMPKQQYRHIIPSRHLETSTKLSNEWSINQGRASMHLPTFAANPSRCKGYARSCVPTRREKKKRKPRENSTVRLQE